MVLILLIRLGGALLITLHGLFHLQMVLAGKASRPVDIASEIIVTISPTVLTLILLILGFNESKMKGE